VTFVLRGVAAPVCQSLFTSMIGVGVAYAAMSRTTRARWAVAAGWVAAVVLHALWNAALAAGVGALASAYVILVAVLVILLVAVALDRRRIVALIVRYLPAHTAAGVATRHDIAMLSSLRERRLARQWARLHGGLAGLRAVANYQLAATELALLHRRAERHLIDDAAFEVRRDGLEAAMRAATSDLLARLKDPPRPPWALGGTSCFGPPAPRPKRRPSGQEPQPG
jgi:hypothetical protein